MIYLASSEKIKLRILMITASDNRYSALGSYFTSLNGIAKLLLDDNFAIPFKKVKYEPNAK